MATGAMCAGGSLRARGSAASSFQWRVYRGELPGACGGAVLQNQYIKIEQDSRLAPTRPALDLKY